MLQPHLQQQSQLPHVGEAQLLGLEAADGRLAQRPSKTSPHEQPHVSLRVPQGHPLLPQLLGQLLHLLLYGRDVFWQRQRRDALQGPGKATSEGLGNQALASPAPTRGRQGIIPSWNSHGGGPGDSAHTSGSGHIPGLTSGRTISLPGAAWALNSIGVSTRTGTGPAGLSPPVPGTGKFEGLCPAMG